MIDPIRNFIDEVKGALNAGNGGGGADFTEADKASIINEVLSKVPNELPPYTEDDHGKALTPTAEGLKWSTVEGGGSANVPSAEGVVF